MSIFLFSATFFTSYGQVESKHGMVVCAHPKASEIGIEVLKEGGNAVDASIAVQLALAVCYPNAGNIGGGGFMIYRSHDGVVDALDFREKAPSLSTKNMYLDASRNIIPDKSVKGAFSIGVPGTVDGLFTAHEKYGKLPFDSLILPAIRLARDGFLLTAKQAREFNKLQDVFNKFNSQNKYFIKKEGWKEGDILYQSDLSRMLDLIRIKGRDGFYRGLIGESIIQTISNGGGIMNEPDLRKYKSVWRTPIKGNYKGFEFISMPPPSSGGITLYQMLSMLEGFNFDSIEHNSVEYIHLLAEVERRAYADRNTYLGDPDFVQIPMRNLMDSSYLMNRISDFSWNKASVSSTIYTGTFNESEETTHLSIVDKEGNAVSVTTTLNSSYGSKVFVNGCGFLLNNEMDDFTSKPGVPNQYGLVQGEANSIQPNKRMLSSMTPTILAKDGRLFMVVGSPGGSTIITSVLQNIMNVIEYDMDMQSSVAAPRFHHQWLPDQVFLEEERFDSTIILGLENMGHTIKLRWPIGRVDAIKCLKKNKKQGGADPRGDDKAIGY